MGALRRRSTLYRIRVNDQWRWRFRYEGGDAFGVEIVDYLQTAYDLKIALREIGQIVENEVRERRSAA
jgi:hypothetical protein